MPRITVQEGAVVQGQLYTNGLIDLKGSVFGNVVCSSFILVTNSSTYTNHLMDAVIDARSWPGPFVGSAILHTASHRQVAAWVE